jgi:L-threonylcarbamoyladenylate synthase
VAQRKQIGSPEWDREDLQRALEILQSGGVILYPTDTVPGLGCDATNPEAIERIYQIKQRPDAKSLVTLVGSEAMLQHYVKEVPALAWDLMDLSERPMTIVYSDVKGLAPNVIATDGSGAIRLPRDPFCLRLISLFKKPIVSTSANISGLPAPRFMEEVTPAIRSAVDYCVRHRATDRTLACPSSIIRLELNGEVKVIRE